MNSSKQPGTFWTPARVAFSFITFALIAGMGFSSCNGPTQVSDGNSNNATKTTDGKSPDVTVTSNNNPTSAPPPSTPLPASVMNTELKALDGDTFTLADYQGKIVVVNLWATWCGPCRSEIPDLVRINDEFKAKGVEVIGLTSEDPEVDLAKVQDFVLKYKINYKIGWGDQTFALALMQGQVRNSIPQSFVISRDGRVLKRFVGYSPVETPPKMRKALEEAVNSK